MHSLRGPGPGWARLSRSNGATLEPFSPEAVTAPAFWGSVTLESVTLSVGIPLCPYGIDSVGPMDFV
ncbi:hypothetical protein T484DRAFT_1969269 [Baffinella frigidus]|nr:hypothetical protein T484DRAFT_1969269 [Cryptophyta sp. CCMP2293]